MLMLCFGSGQNQLAEWLDIEHRDRHAFILHAIWNVGRLATTLVWLWPLPPAEVWRIFFCVQAGAPLLIFACFALGCFARFESPRYLAVSGQPERAVALLRAAAEQDGAPLPPSFESGKLRLPEDRRRRRGAAGRGRAALGLVAAL